MSKLTLGMAVAAVFTLGAIVSAPASALEAGLLPLPGTTFEGIGLEGNEAVATTLKTPGGEIACTTILASASLGMGVGEKTHIKLGIISVDFTGCKKGKINCSSENIEGGKDPKETILLNPAYTTMQFVNLLNAAKELEPGVAIALLELELAGKKLPLVINCGAIKVMIKGSELGLILASLTVDVTSITLDFTPAGETCDTGETTCEKYAAEPLLGNFAGVFESAALSTKVVLTSKEMFLVDD